MVRDFAVWLNDTSLSLFFKETSWIVPAVQAVHILAIGIVLSAFVMLTLRVHGRAARGVAIDLVNARFMPWVWWSLATLLVTGVVMIVAEPGRALPNAFFQAKMVLIAIIATLLLLYGRSIGRAGSDDVFNDDGQGLVDGAEKTVQGSPEVFPAPVRALFAAVTVMTLVIIFCGRWIAYSEGAPLL